MKVFEDIFPYASQDVNIDPHNFHDEVVHDDFNDVIVTDFGDEAAHDESMPSPTQHSQPISSPQNTQPTTLLQPTQERYDPLDPMNHHQTSSMSSGPHDPPESPSFGPTDSAHNQQDEHTSNSSFSAHNDDTSPVSLGRGLRQKIPNVRYRDYVTHAAFANSTSSSSSNSNSSSGTSYPIAHYIHCDKFSVNYQHFLAAIVKGHDPKSFKEAMHYVEWQRSMQEEIKALEDNGTWSLVPLPPGKRALGSQWVYKTKYFSTGEVERLKSRLVVLGNHQ